MSATPLHLHDVSFAYDAQSRPLLSHLTLQFPRGWTGVVGANGAGKTTLLQLATGLLSPTSGRVTPTRLDARYCAQRTDAAPPDLAQLIDANDGAAWRVKGPLEIGHDWAARWQTLSHGERKRAQIAVALWSAPDVLAIDEPANHLDADARTMLAAALSAFRGVGLLVSHDRALLDRLCARCLFVEPRRTTMRPGGVSAGIEAAEREAEEARRARALADREVRRVSREVAARREEASDSHKKRSKFGLALKDHDGRHRINTARMSGKDGQAGRRLKQLAGRARQLDARAASISVDKVRTLGISIGGRRSHRDALLRLDAGRLPLGGDRAVTHGPLTLLPADRLALVGPNGAGKSALVRHLVAHLEDHLPDGEVAYLPQEFDARAGARLIDEVRALPRDVRGRALGVVSRLGSDPARLLESANPSPGECRKLLIALGLSRSPVLLVLDEPTNHLDLPSIRCLQQALAECPAALLLVSHDAALIDALDLDRWTIRDGRLHTR